LEYFIHLSYLKKIFQTESKKGEIATVQPSEKAETESGLLHQRKRRP
jgi:hypothetical protein